MTALSFPNNPNVNDVFPPMLVPGVPQWRFDGSKWRINAGDDIGKPPVIIATTPPTGIEQGQLWWDEVGGQLYVFDANNQWVVTGGAISEDAPADGRMYGRQDSGWVQITTPVTTGPTAPSNPRDGDLWNDTNSEPPTLKVWNGSSWQLSAAPATGFLPLTGGVLSGPLTINTGSAGNTHTSLTTFGNIYGHGRLNASHGIITGGNVSTAANPRAIWVLTGNVGCQGGNFISQGSQPSVCCWNTSLNAAYGMTVGVGANYLAFGVMNGNGGITSTMAYMTSTGAFQIHGSPWCPGGGGWNNSSSDIRTKTVRRCYDHGLSEIEQLNPIVYTYKGNNTDEPPPRDEPAPYKKSTHYNVAIEGTEFIGLVAQDVEEVMPELVKKKFGFIDGNAVNDLRGMDTSPLLFALINSCKELAARVKDLEEKLAAR